MLMSEVKGLKCTHVRGEGVKMCSCLCWQRRCLQPVDNLVNKPGGVLR